jgi:alkylation response protein AidB-like acyl-CoA dehydrogenase
MSGLLGIIIPKADGGAGVSHVTLAEVVARLAAADPAVAQVPQNHFAFLEVIRHSGTKAQRAFFFNEVLHKGARPATRSPSAAPDL